MIIIRMKALASKVWTTLKTHKWKSIAIGVTLLLIALAVKGVTSPKAPEYITEDAERGDLLQTVEAVGTVISEKDLQLQFRTAGIVSELLVDEGDIVEAGDKLASLRAGDLSASVAAAVARLRQAEASLQALVEGTRPEEIAIAEAQLANKRASLEAAKSTLANAEESVRTTTTKLQTLKAEANTGLSGQVSVVGSSVAQELTAAEQSLLAIDDIFGQNDVIEAMNNTNPGGLANARTAKTNAVTAIQKVRNEPLTFDYQQALAYMDRAKAAIQQAVSAIGIAYNEISNTPEIANFTHTDKETHKATLATKQAAAESAQTDVETLQKNLRDASAAYDTRISTEEYNLSTAQGTKQKAEADIRTYETSILIDEANLALKKAGARQADINAARASVDAARAEVARASASLGDTVITAPISGRITKVNAKVGEFTPTGPVITMIGESPYRIEMFVSEIDIPKVQLTQSGSIELDAFLGTDYTLRVSEIDEAQTEVEGVSKYRVKLDFVYPHEEFKIGMTGDAVIVTGMREDVVYIPRRAILERSNGELYTRILTDNGEVEERTVTLGMESGGGEVEILSGVEAGETVIVLVKE